MDDLRDYRKGQIGERTARRSVARSTTFTFGSSVLAAATSLINVMVTARILGAAGRGQLAFLITVALLGAHLFALGVHQAVANLAAGLPDRSAKIAGTSMGLSMLLGLAGAASMFGILQAFPTVLEGEPWWLSAIALVAIPVGITQLCLQHLAIAHYGFGVNNAAWLIGPVTTLALNLGFIYFGVFNVTFAITAWTVGQAAGTSFLLWAALRHYGGFSLPSLRAATELLSFGIKDHLGRVLTLGNYRLDQWILGAMAGAGALGTYSAAVAFSEVLYFLPSALVVVQRPDLVKATKEDARAQTTRAFRITLLLSLPAAGALFLLAPIVVMLFGEDFAESGPQLRLLVLGTAGLIAVKIFSNALTSQGAPLLATLAASVMFTALVTFDLLLIPYFGAMGAAAAAALAFNLSGLSAAMIFQRRFGGRLRELSPRTRDLLDLVSTLRRLLRVAMNRRSV